MANKLKSKKSEERSSVPILLAVKNNAMMGFLTIYSLIESLYLFFSAPRLAPPALC